MTSLVDSLFRIDPTQGLTNYVNEVKPYHSKVLDILTEYIYTESISVTMTDALSWDIALARSDVDVVRTCGFGTSWDPERTTEMELTTQIISAQSATLPHTYPVNTFLVEKTVGAWHTCAVINMLSNQLMFAHTFNVIGVQPSSGVWIVSGDITSYLTIGADAYIHGDTGSGGNKGYEIESFVVTNGNTYVTMTTAISSQANADGMLSVAIDPADLPAWPTGMAVSLTSTGTLPDPVTSSSVVYFIPTQVAGVFNLSTKRYPTQLSDYVNLTTLGVGTLSIRRSETFFPGAPVEVVGSYIRKNDGKYIVVQTVDEDSYVRVYVLQKVPYTTPSSLAGDGIMKLSFSSFDAPSYCPISQAPDLYTSAYVHETLTFEFSMTFGDTVGAAASERSPYGFGVDSYGSPYSIRADYLIPNSAYVGTTVSNGSLTSTPTHMILPHGIDTQLFDVGEFVELLENRPLKP